MWHIKHVVTWQIKEVIFPLSQGLWTPSLAGWWLRMTEPHPQVTWNINHVVTWQIKDVKSPLSQALWNPNLPEWWRRVKGPHLKSHVTDGSSGHVTNQKYFIFTFTRPKAHNLSRVITRMRRPHPAYHMTPQSRLHVATIQLVLYISSTSSWSSLLKRNRFQMIVKTLKMCSLHKESFYGDIVAGCLYWKYVLK